ncbi:low molecular weight phosphatase family protein [Zhengella mangrovi]|uniref:Low molecular weight phosphatase family protein n=1 Tax=Zhengella mangrovi TaxID=1982044 RepID=A0A2G1QUN0_9HYPH|nr:arsenate reductase ArsC [Zhengella mangrovi]PHP69169.1 low molecular weight phosphatase family protein [Zhengella mangrovi]
MTATPVNILILCTANSARSILGEALIQRIGQGRFQAYSAGSHPRGVPNPIGLKLLESLGYDPAAFRSKSWDEFAGPDAPQMDIVITVCDSAAGGSCPLWPGAPVKAHWGIPDPAGKGETEDEQLAAFRQAYDRLEARVTALAALPVEAMTSADLKAALAAIGTLEGATDMALGAV